ncbi:hypothetical protein EH31_12040 [Erythrobacter longus]|uniref:Uncharacterized protein n=1 Tax=Erythrobacter longus TaxID=1044 RepID=A0A074MUS8_ERYLO|nr:hypothetical protein [Erythrobacter longus]KEO89372.1 hypothetical protein EH31_12040 [Erythrobacter longus]
MSIRSWIKTALLKQGWIIVRAPIDDKERTAQLVELLVEENADGRSRRHTLGPWLWYERPVLDRFEGHDCGLTVEGPIYQSRDGTGYPLGSQLRTEFGWLDLTPEETNLLADEVRTAIDHALLRWFTCTDMAERQLPSRQSRERYFDDDFARNLIRSATPPTAQREEVCDG